MSALSGVTRRPETEADTPFLLSLYATTRADELERVAWTASEKQAFVAMQFDAQRQHYRRVYPDARFEILERDGVAIGRLYVDESGDEVRVVDVIISPDARNLGIGRALLTEVLEAAARTRRTVVIHVERFNRAQHLYARLGFQPVGGGDDVYIRMEARPPD